MRGYNLLHGRVCVCVCVCVCWRVFKRNKKQNKNFKVGMALFRRLITGRGHLLQLRDLI